MDISHLVTEEIKGNPSSTSENFKGGICACTVSNAERTYSAAGNDMLVLKIMAVDPQGETANLTEYFVFSEKMMFKVKHFCEAAHMKTAWDEKTFGPEECLGSTFDAKVALEKSKDDRYSDKWKIKYFIATEIYETFKDGKKPDSKKKDSFEDDDIPF